MSKAILTAEAKESRARRAAKYRASPKGKAAIAAYNKKYADENAERLRAYRAEKWVKIRNSDKELRSVERKDYREKNKEAINATRRDALEADPELRERAAVRSAKWYKDNKEAVASKAKAYYLENTHKVRANILAYQKLNPNRVRLWSRVRVHRRRVRLNEAGGAYKRQDVERLLVLQRNQCANCHKSLDDGYHIDHRIPIAKGGDNHPHNIELLCPPCNYKKSAKWPHEFAQENGRLL